MFHGHIKAQELYQIVFSGESLAEMSTILKKTPSLSLKKKIDGKFRVILNQQNTNYWDVSNMGSVVILDSEQLKTKENLLDIRMINEGAFYIHVLRVTPPNVINIIFSSKVDAGTKTLKFNLDDLIEKFEY